MKAIILAAGSGSRLAPLTRETPKCLLDMGNGTSILEYQLWACAQCCIEEVVVIAGFRRERIREAVQDLAPPGLAVRVLSNPWYDQYNNLHSLWLARHDLTEETIVMNGDTVFDYRILENLLHVRTQQVVLAIDRKSDYDDDDMKVRTSGGAITAVSKAIPSSLANGESIGVMKFHNGGAERMRDVLNRLVNTGAGLQQFYLKAIQVMIHEGCPVGFHETRGRRWQEVDYPHDLNALRNTVHLYPQPVYAQPASA